jgi:hypothetical protein
MARNNRLILEFTEFNAQRLNPDSAQMGVSVDDPQLSINAFDKHEDAIRTGVSRINNILNSLANTSTFRALKSKLGLESQNIQHLKIQRVIKKDEVNYVVYITFMIDGEQYYGQVENILSSDPMLKSEVFKDTDLIQTKEWVIRTKGLIIKTIKKWLKPDEGVYKLNNEYVICYSVDTGKMAKIEKDSEIEVIRSYDNKILIKYENDFFNLVNDNFIYFNWWFEKIN